MPRNARFSSPTLATLLLAPLVGCTMEVVLPETEPADDPPPSPPVEVEVAAQEPAPPGVSVVVTRDGNPVVGATVAFHDALGAIVDQRVVPASGLVASDASEVAAVSAIWAPEVVSVLGVEPGEVIALELGVAAPEAATSPATAPLVLPPKPDGVHAWYFEVDAGCATTKGWPGSPSFVPVGATCANGDGTFDVLAVGKWGGEPTAYLLAPGLALSASTLPADAPQVEAAWRTDFREVPFEVLNLEASTYTEASIALDDAAGRIVDRRPHELSGVMRIPGVLDGAMRARFLARDDTAGASTVWAGPLEGSLWVVDAEAMLPMVSAVDVGERVVTVDAEPDPHGHVVLEQEDEGSRWTVYAPPSARTIHLPLLPSSSAGWRPKGTRWTVSLFDPGWGDAALVRSRPVELHRHAVAGAAGAPTEVAVRLATRAAP